MTTRNERVEREESKEMKKTKVRLQEFERKCLYIQTIDVIDQQEDIKQRL